MPSPKILNDATPKRSSLSFRSCKLLTATVGSCSVSDCAIFSKPRPQERQKFWPSEFLFPQLGQYMAHIIRPSIEVCSQKQQKRSHTGVCWIPRWIPSYLMLTVIEYALLRAS